MLEIHDGDEDILILARGKEDTITELFILADGKENVIFHEIYFFIKKN